MAKSKRSAFDDFVSIAAILPWKAALILAVISYLGFHYLASLPPLPIPTGTNNFGQSIGSSIVRQALISFAMFLQYLVPLAFVIGAALSLSRGRRQAELHAQIATAPTRSALESISWSEFEGLAAEVFRRKGYAVIERGGDGPDGGVDLALRMGKDKYLVQCKQWKTHKVGVATVRELYGVMAAEGAVGGFVVASGDFTDDARSFAEGRSIRLVPTESLLRLVNETGGINTGEHQQAAVPRCPKCGSGMVQRKAKQGQLAGSSFWGCSRYPACRGIRKTDPE